MLKAKSCSSIVFTLLTIAFNISSVNHFQLAFSASVENYEFISENVTANTFRSADDIKDDENVKLQDKSETAHVYDIRNGAANNVQEFMSLGLNDAEQISDYSSEKNSIKTQNSEKKKDVDRKGPVYVKFRAGHVVPLKTSNSVPVVSLGSHMTAEFIEYDSFNSHRRAKSKKQKSKKAKKCLAEKKKLLKKLQKQGKISETAKILTTPLRWKKLRTCNQHAVTDDDVRLALQRFPSLEYLPFPQNLMMQKDIHPNATCIIIKSTGAAACINNLVLYTEMPRRYQNLIDRAVGQKNKLMFAHNAAGAMSTAADACAMVNLLKGFTPPMFVVHLTPGSISLA